MRRYKQRGVGHFMRKFQVERDIVHQPLLVSESWSDFRFLWYQNIGNKISSFRHKALVSQTDGQMDRITITKTALA